MENNVVRALSHDGGIVMCAIDSTAIVEEMRKIHDTSPVMTAALGRTLTAASLMGSFLKSPDDSLTLSIKGGGPAGKLLAVSDYLGNVRGFCDNPLLELPLNPQTNKLDVAGAVGTDGTLTIIKDMGMREPYVGQVSLVSGEIALDIATYYTQSEQIPTACALGVLVDVDRTVKSAGGYILQLMPGATDSEIDLIERNIGALDPVSALIAQGKCPEDIINMVMQGFQPDILDSFEAGYVCHCSRERMEQALISLPHSDIDEIIEKDGKAEMVCSFCNKKYNFTKEELTAIKSHSRG